VLDAAPFPLAGAYPRHHRRCRDASDQASQLFDPGGSDWLWVTLGGKSADAIGGLTAGEVATIRTR